MTDSKGTQIILETPRLRLRTYEPHDLDPLHRLWNDTDVMRFIRPGWAPSREEVETYFLRVAKRWDKHGFSHLAVTTKDCDALIGYCGFQQMKELPEVELLYGLAKPHWGLGYTTEAADTCLRFAFEKTSLDRIVALANPLNTGSWRVMEKIGMKFEKIVRLDEEELVCYTMSRDDFVIKMESDAKSSG